MFSKKKQEKQEKTDEKKVEKVSEPTNITEEKEPVEKPKVKGYFIRSLSALLALASVGFAFYALFLLVKDGLSTSDSISSYLLLTDKTASQSKAVYDTFLTTNQKGIKDYAFIGNKLFVSESKITPNLIEGKDGSAAFGKNYLDIALWDVTNNISFNNALTSDSKNGKFYIDLQEAPTGDYLIYPYQSVSTNHEASNTAPYSLSEKESISKTFYTPIENGKRRKIVFKNNSASPFTLISITETGTILPNDYYDAVIFYQQYNLEDSASYSYTEGEISALQEAVISINNAGNYKVVFAENLKSANAYNSTYSICLSKHISSDYNSLYIQKDGYICEKLLDGSSLNDYDKYPEIREMTGYLDKAGEAYQDVLANDVLSGLVTRYGKESVLLEMDSDLSTQLVSYLNLC